MGKSLLGMALAAGVSAMGIGNSYADDEVTKAKRELSEYIIDHGIPNTENKSLFVRVKCYDNQEEKYRGVIYKFNMDERVNAIVHGAKSDDEMDAFFIRTMKSVKSTNINEIDCFISTEQFLAKYKALRQEWKASIEKNETDFENRKRELNLESIGME